MFHDGIDANGGNDAMLRMTIAMLAVLTVGAPPAVADALSGPEIRRALIGNTIMNPRFGCSHYRADGTAVQKTIRGTVRVHEWNVRGDRYFSSANCSEIGCTVTMRGPSLSFQRTDGEFQVNAILLNGNRCFNAPVS